MTKQPTSHLRSRHARLKLAPRHRPYYQTVVKGRALGYRRASDDKAGRWSVREIVDGTQRYASLEASADDFTDANGRDVLTFDQAVHRAMQGVDGLRGKSGDTVSHALDDYLRHLEREGRATPDTRRKVEMARTALGATRLRALTAEQIRDWHYSLSRTPPMARDGKPRKGVDMNDPEVQRRRKDSANRDLNTLKAALNHVYRRKAEQYGIDTDSAWRSVEPFKGVSRERDRYLSKDEIQRLLDACPPDLRALVNGALQTAARIGDLRMMKVGDFRADSGTVLVGNLKARYKGKPRNHVYLTKAGIRFFHRQTAGRDDDEWMFTRADGIQWKRSMERDPLAAAMKRAGIDPPATFHMFRHTWATHAAHAEVPLWIIAQNLGHSSTKMVERHYAHHSDTVSRRLIQERMPEWDDVEENNVEPMMTRHG